MSETAPSRRYPLDTLSARAKPSTAVSLEALGPFARLSLRAEDEAAIGRLGEAFGVALPRETWRRNAANTRGTLWLGPDEWLLLAPGEDGPALHAELSAALGEAPHSLVDVSERSVAIAVAGRQAATLLNAACPLDLSLDACPVGFASRTVFAKAEIILMRLEEERFELDVWRSFAPYVWAYLEEARREFLA